MRRTDRGQIITLSCIAGLSTISLATPAIVLATRQESNVVSVEIENIWGKVASTNEIDFSLGTTYKLTMFWSDLLKIGAKDQPGGWVLASSNDKISAFNMIKSGTCKFYVGTKAMTPDVDFKCQGPYVIPFQSLGLTSKSKITIEFELDEINVEIGFIGVIADFGKQ